MRQWLLIGALCLAGCQNVIGPFRHRQPQRVDDPNISISEQQRRGRDLLALPEESPTVAPNAGLDLPDQGGR